jgi:hypothetical protein
MAIAYFIIASFLSFMFVRIDRKLEKLIKIYEYEERKDNNA